MTHVFSLGKCLFKYFAFLLYCLFIIKFSVFFVYPGYKPFIKTMFHTFFSYFVACLFSLLTGSFEEKFLFYMKSLSFFMGCAYDISNLLFLNQKSQRFSSKSFIVLDLGLD